MLFEKAKKDEDEVLVNAYDTLNRRCRGCGMSDAKATTIIPSLVSTIIPVHNRPALLQEAVASVLSQTYRPLEIVIVDDGSTDETPAVGLKLASDYPDEVIYINILHNGPGAAREAGRQVAKGEFIQYLDSDDILLPQKFELQVQGLRRHPECGVSYGKTRYYHISTGSNDIAIKRTGERIDKMFPSFLQSRWWSTHTPLFIRLVTDKAGPWLSLRNEEDWEYDCRVASQGVRLHYCDEFVSETIDHNGNRLSHDGSTDPVKLSDRATAHRLIYQHARKAGITSEIPEMQHFARECFLLCRQCGAAGLAVEAEMLFELARKSSGGQRGNGIDFRAYRLATRLLGWNNVGKLACCADRVRL